MPIASPELLLREAAKRAQQRVTEHIERFAAAYIKTTKIKPEEAVMCYKYMDDGSMRIWFEKQPDKTPLDLSLIARMMDAAGMELVKNGDSVQCGNDYLREAEKIRQYTGAV